MFIFNVGLIVGSVADFLVVNFTVVDVAISESLPESKRNTERTVNDLTLDVSKPQLNWKDLKHVKQNTESLHTQLRASLKYNT